jgi:lipoyl(octanoyl) transferase
VQIPVIDLGRRSYAAAYEVQLEHHAEVLASRERGEPESGRILLVEHDPPVITISRRPGARAHLLASEELLARYGVTIAETDRGGDITYHGPGQLVVYPIVDLNHLKLGLHDYMRLLEASVIDCCAGFGVAADRDPSATGVWVPGGGHSAKICAMGVRVRRWVTLHGLALNVTTNIEHFGLIVPCGLVGRGVTSLARELSEGCPRMDTVKSSLAAALVARLLQARERAVEDRSGSGRISG